MRKSIILALFTTAAMPLSTLAQGTNDGLGEEEVDLKSLYEMVTKHEQKSKALELYINYGAAAQATHDSRNGEWGARIYNRYLKIEMVGWLTDHIYYRFRQRINKSNVEQSEDNFSKANDYMMVGWKFNDHWSIQGGKKCQALGSFEFSENPLFIYQYSDLEGNIDSSKGAINVVYNPTPDQQINAEVSNTYNGKLADEFGKDAKISNGKMTSDGNAEPKPDIVLLQKASAPLTYALGWNGKFFGGKLQTRWSYMLRTQAKDKYSQLIRFGQKLKLDRLQWYVDYSISLDDLDRMKITTREVAKVLAPTETDLYMGKICNLALVTKMNWQFTPDWNLMLKGTYETASMTQSEQFRNYRKAYGYVGSVEYYPARKQQQDLRFYLAYMGRKYSYSKRSTLTDYNTDRIELGMIYRMKLL